MFRNRNRLLLRVITATILLIGAVPSGIAHHMVVRVNLEEMTARADRIFVGQCVAVKESFQMIAQGNMPVTVYSFEVEQAIKGNLPKRLTFTQLGHAQPVKARGGQVTMHGQPIGADTLLHGANYYQIGDHVLIFLVPNYLDGKVTQPVGLYQGAFRISQMASGQQLARNSINNMGLFTAPFTGSAMSRAGATTIFPELDNPIADVQGLSPASKALAGKRGPVPLDSLLELVDRINVSHGQPKGGILQ
jgi:hypothetical protein